MNNRIVTICIPGNAQTGGPEALHQLAHEINTTGLATSKVYYTGIVDREIVRDYRKRYEFTVSDTIEMSSRAVVLPEFMDPKDVPVPHGAKVFVWWLAALKPFPASSYDGVAHLFQSKFAAERLAAFGFSGQMLSDYLSSAHQDIKIDLDTKEDIAVYNGAKSALLASRIRLDNEKIKLIPIRGLTPAAVATLLRRAKVYLDFGPHPGKDRLPREAALAGCAVITNRRGSAGNREDLPIPDMYQNADENPKQVLELILNIFSDFSKHHARFEQYRASIKSQKVKFRTEVVDFLSQLGQVPNSHASSESLTTSLDAIVLFDQKQMMKLEDRANQLALEVEKLMSTQSILFAIRNDVRKFHNSLTRYFRRRPN